MDLQNRCPECGQRLKSNYCDICMRKVSFGGVRTQKYRDPWEVKDGSSAHRAEKDHECISFEKEKRSFRRPKPAASNPKKMLKTVAIVIALISALSTVFGIVEEMSGAESVAVPEPEINVSDGFVEAGDPGAENVPKVVPGEIYNENGVRVTVDTAGLSYGDYCIYLTIQNDTEHKISVNADQLSINGYMLPFGMYQDVKAGKTEQTRLTFYDYELEKSGIEKIGKVEFILDIYDEYLYESTRKLVTIETDYANDFSTVPPVAGLPLYMDEDLTVLLQDVTLDGSGDCNLCFYVQNHTQSTLSLYSETVWVNGEETSCFLWNMLRPNTCAVDDTYIYDLGDLGIQSLEEIREITMELEIELMDDYELLESRNESITIDPSAVQ